MAVRAAIVGLGWWGQTLVSAVQGSSDRIRFVRGITRTPAKAEAFCRQHGIPLGADMTEVLNDPDVDAVVLATPHLQHVEQIRQVARAGKHIFVEKPLTLKKVWAEDAVKAANEAGVVLSIGHNRRFLPAVRRLKQMIDGDELGRIVHVEGNMSGPSGRSHATSNWRADPEESPAGGMTGKGIHIADLMIHFFGPITEVDSRSFSQVMASGLDDTTVMLFRFASGMTGYLATLTVTANIWRVAVFGTKGWAEMRGYNRVVVNLIESGERVEDFGPIDIERAELDAFADAVTGKGPYPVPNDEVVQNVAVLEAIVTSANEGRVVRV